jgi:hypothetical protein
MAALVSGYDHMRIGLEAFRAWRRRSASESDLSRTIPRWERVAPQVPARYLPLYKYLEHRYATTVVLSFAQIDALLGFALPESARTDYDWWTADAGVSKTHASAWTAADRTASPNLVAGNVVFERHG